MRLTTAAPCPVTSRAAPWNAASAGSETQPAGGAYFYAKRPMWRHTPRARWFLNTEQRSAGASLADCAQRLPSRHSPWQLPGLSRIVERLPGLRPALSQGFRCPKPVGGGRRDLPQADEAPSDRQALCLRGTRGVPRKGV